MQHPSLRRESHSYPDTPLVLGDPCGGVPALAESKGITLDVDYSGLYDCWYSTADKDHVLTQLRVGPDPSKKSTRSSERMTIYVSAGSCMAANQVVLATADALPQ